MKKIIALFCSLVSLHLAAQNVGIGTTIPHASAKLDITDTARGILIPRMTAARRDAIASPANGLLVFSTTDSSFYFYHNNWRKLMDSTAGWGTLGNKGTDPTLHFIGTTDFVPLRFKVWNENAGILDPDYLNAGFGLRSLDSVTTGSGNIAAGSYSLWRNKTGHYNAAMGYGSLPNLLSGNNNVGLGQGAGAGLQSGSQNNFLGYATRTSKPDLQYSTAIGALAVVDQDRSIVLGDRNTRVGIGHPKPATQLSNNDSNMIASNGTGVNFQTLN